MRVGLIAEKIGMSRFYDKHNVNHAVTVLKVRDCKVVSIKNKDKHGYNAVALSHGKYTKSVAKPFKSFLKKNNLTPFSLSKEFRLSETTQLKMGESVNVSNFLVGQFIDVSSNSIGKGFAGGMKRHNFSGNRATHGVSISHRSHGSTGQCQDPGKVFKGKKMAGRLGNKKVTIQNLKVLNIDLENNLIIVKGAVPGHKGSVLKIVDSVKKNQNIVAPGEPNDINISGSSDNKTGQKRDIENQVTNNQEEKDNNLDQKIVEGVKTNNTEVSSGKVEDSETTEIKEDSTGSLNQENTKAD